MPIPKSKRSYRNEPLLTACMAAQQRAGALEILQAMPSDVNGAPWLANKLLLTAGGSEGW